jgi:hypothetical protein
VKVKGSLAAEMRRKARGGDGEPAMWTVGGWRFGLSCGPTPNPTREDFDRHGRSVAERVGLDSSATYEQLIAAMEVARASGVLADSWILSASLHPIGRSSTEEDWEYLGKMVAALRVPPGALRTSLETTDPNAVHYWTWSEKPSN